jgi:hypothetical protein
MANVRVSLGTVAVVAAAVLAGSSINRPAVAATRPTPTVLLPWPANVVPRMVTANGTTFRYRQARAVERVETPMPAS